MWGQREAGGGATQGSTQQQELQQRVQTRRVLQRGAQQRGAQRLQWQRQMAPLAPQSRALGWLGAPQLQQAQRVRCCRSAWPATTLQMGRRALRRALRSACPEQRLNQRHETQRALRLRRRLQQLQLKHQPHQVQQPLRTTTAV